MMEWFINFLSERMQQTKFNECMSKQIEVPIELPQGTALSVILFIIYINKITKLALNGNIILFADDTMLVVKSKDVSDAIRKLNDDLKKIENWLNENKLSLNKSKTNYMMLSRGNINDNLDDVMIEQTKIDRVNSIKYLGIILVDKLNFQEQINVCAKNKE